MTHKGRIKIRCLRVPIENHILVAEADERNKPSRHPFLTGHQEIALYPSERMLENTDISLSFMLGIGLLTLVSGVLLYKYAWQRRPMPSHDDVSEEAVAAAPAAPVWCLVGENTLGRWCVQAPYTSSCSPMNRYGSQEACEMVDASSLPLGVTRLGGAVMSPFMRPRPAMVNTF